MVYLTQATDTRRLNFQKLVHILMQDDDYRRAKCEVAHENVSGKAVCKKTVAVDRLLVSVVGLLGAQVCPALRCLSSQI